MIVAVVAYAASSMIIGAIVYRPILYQCVGHERYTKEYGFPPPSFSGDRKVAKKN